MFDRRRVYVVLCLVAGCGSSSSPRADFKSKELVGSALGSSCSTHSDCIVGAHCTQNSCEVGPCSGLILGKLPRKVIYNYDDDNYELLRSEEVNGKPYQRVETRYDDDHRTAEYWTFAPSEFARDPAQRTPDAITIRHFDDSARPLADAFRDEHGEQVGGRTYVYDSLACPSAVSGQAFDAAGHSVATISTTCNDQGQIVRTVETSTDTNKPVVERVYLYDDLGRRSEFRKSSSSSGKAREFTMKYKRDQHGFIVETRIMRTWDPSPEIEKMDVSCWSVSSTALRRR